MLNSWRLNLFLLFLILCSSLSIDIEDSEISYLESYGYIDADITVAALRTDDFYSEKIREFQEMLALPLTGVMDTATKNMMKAPRCGLRDKEVRRGKRDRSRVMRKWPKKALTYWVKNAPISDNNYDEVRREIKKAFKAWEDVMGLTIEEKESSNGMDVD
uniref:PG_binding_1 domain-containing protein n=1 Tax=Steinernema glaseri TaxID=37863 RepID=A0A1I8A2V0_9BILA